MYDYRFPQQQYRRMAQVAVPVTAPVVAAPPASVVPAGAPVPEGLFWTALAGAASYAAIQTATRKGESTWVRAAGWAGGVAAGLAALTGLAGVVAPSYAKSFPVRWYWV